MRTCPSHVNSHDLMSCLVSSSPSAVCPLLIVILVMLCMQDSETETETETMTGARDKYKEAEIA